MPMDWFVQNFYQEFSIAQELQELTTNIYETVKSFANWS